MQQGIEYDLLKDIQCVCSYVQVQNNDEYNFVGWMVEICEWFKLEISNYGIVFF